MEGKNKMMTWHCSSFEELTSHLLYDLIRARIEVFIVEQNCPYSELDGIDTRPDTKHIFALENKRIAAYARVIAPHISYPDHSSIGRVLVTSKYRNQKIGHELIQYATQTAFALWPDRPIQIGAQSHLDAFYQSHHFKTVSAPYLEDGIEHIYMVLKPSSVQ